MIHNARRHIHAQKGGGGDTRTVRALCVTFSPGTNPFPQMQGNSPTKVSRVVCVHKGFTWETCNTTFGTPIGPSGFKRC